MLEKTLLLTFCVVYNIEIDFPNFTGQYKLCIYMLLQNYGKKIVFIELIVMMKSNLNQIGLDRKYLKHDMDYGGQDNLLEREKSGCYIYVCVQVLFYYKLFTSSP